MMSSGYGNDGNKGDVLKLATRREREEAVVRVGGGRVVRVVARQRRHMRREREREKLDVYLIKWLFNEVNSMTVRFELEDSTENWIGAELYSMF